MKRLSIYCITNIVVLNLPIFFNKLLKLETINNINYISESVQGIIMFYIAIYGLDKMKKYAVNHSQYKDKYEKIITKERVNVFIKFLSIIQNLFSLMLVAIPLSLVKYVDYSSITIIICIVSFVMSFGIGCNYILTTKRKFVI